LEAPKGNSVIIKGGCASPQEMRHFMILKYGMAHTAVQTFVSFA
jgi:hypothetical protein